MKDQPIRYINGHGKAHKRVDMSDAAPFKIDGEYCKLIPLSQGLFCIVNIDDFRWLNQWLWCAAFDNCTGGYYAQRKTGDSTTKMHRAILDLQVGDIRQGDHKNMLTLDNRRSNLRIATQPQNKYNAGRTSANTSGFKGVSFHAQTGKWRSEIRAEGVHHSLGLFFTPEEAHAAYVAASKKYHGEFQRSA